jgi:hypothetical protein
MASGGGEVYVRLSVGNLLLVAAHVLPEGFERGSRLAQSARWSLCHHSLALVVDTYKHSLATFAVMQRDAEARTSNADAPDQTISKYEQEEGHMSAAHTSRWAIIAHNYPRGPCSTAFGVPTCRAKSGSEGLRDRLIAAQPLSNTVKMEAGGGVITSQAVKLQRTAIEPCKVLRISWRQAFGARAPSLIAKKKRDRFVSFL